MTGRHRSWLAVAFSFSFVLAGCGEEGGGGGGGGSGGAAGSASGGGGRGGTSGGGAGTSGGGAGTSGGGAGTSGGGAGTSGGGAGTSGGGAGTSGGGGAGTGGRGGTLGGGGTGVAGGGGTGVAGGGGTGVAGGGGASGGTGGRGGGSAGGGGGAAGRGGSSGSGGAAGAGGGAGGSVGGGGGSAGAGGRGGGAGGGGAGAGGRGGGGGGGASGAGGAAAFRPCPTNGDPCRILPLGDSITDGFNIPGGWRMEVFRRALAANHRITYVGSQVNGPTTVDGTTFPRNHEGRSGWKITEIAGLVPSPALNTVPHIVLVMAGTNDVIQSDTLSTAPQRLGSLLDELFAGAPNALVVVARLTPLSDQYGASRVPPFNNALPALVQQRAAAGRHVVLVDMFTGFPESELADGIHPNAAGYTRMAGVWYAAIDDFLP